MIMAILKTPIIIASIIAIIGVLIMQWIFPEFIFILKYILYFILMISTFTKGYDLIENKIKQPMVSLLSSLTISILIILMLSTIPFSLLLIITIIIIMIRMLLR